MNEKEANNWILRALATVAACQQYGVEIPRLDYGSLVFLPLSGRLDELAKICKDYVEGVLPKIQEAEKARRQG